jgi:ATP synthase protein I
MVRRVDAPACQDFSPLLDFFAMSAEGKGQDPGHGQISPEERAAIRQRSSDLGKKLDVANARRADSSQTGSRQKSAYGQAFRFASELIVGVVLGGVLGWALDRQFETAPWLMILLVVLGFAAGLLNVIRAAQKAQAENEASQKAFPPISDNDDDV